MNSDTCKFHPLKPSKNCRVCKSIGIIPELPSQSSTISFIKPEKKHGPIAMHGDKNS